MNGQFLKGRSRRNAIQPCSKVTGRFCFSGNPTIHSYSKGFLTIIIPMIPICRKHFFVVKCVCFIDSDFGQKKVQPILLSYTTLSFYETLFSRRLSTEIIGTMSIPQKKLLTPCTRSQGSPAMIQAIVP